TARSLARRRKNLAEDLEAAAAYEEIVDALFPCIEIPRLPPEYEYLGVMFEGNSWKRREALESDLKTLSGGLYVFAESLISEKRIVMLLGVPRAIIDATINVIDDRGHARIALPRHLRSLPFRDGVRACREEIAALRKKKATVEAQARDFFAKNSVEILALRDLCGDKLARFSAMKAIAVTRRAYIIRGWIPEGELASVGECANAASAGAASIRILAPGAGEAPPVKIDNPPMARVFEPLSRLFPLPRYGTVDPTLFMALFFPPIFGLMLADIGYGLILATGAIIIAARSRRRSLSRKLSFVVIACAAWSMLMGAVFGEFFGETGKLAFGLEPLWRERFAFSGPHRAEILIGYMALAISVGFIHVVLGLILGFINARRTADRGKAFDSLAKIAGLFALLLGTGLLVGILPRGLTSAWVAALVAFAALMIHRILHEPAHGLLLPLEVLGTMGNILSYVRIMAVGLVSVVLAFLANLFGEMINNVILATIVSLLVHALNLALGIVDPTIQGLRHHYVEFSSKFFTGGGSP
ncbi:MAG: V-type ATPase 116kDa subunit family protein, partial [Spirochaetaceae bacterium]|nr:V-type ATPase 116kDa subunit family protein [Spirochaetaceae bacterium]